MAVTASSQRIAIKIIVVMVTSQYGYETFLYESALGVIMSAIHLSTTVACNLKLKLLYSALLPVPTW